MPGGEQTFFSKRTYVRKRIERLFLRVTNVCSYRRKNVCSPLYRTFVRKPDSRNKNVCSGIKNIRSELKANIYSERMFRIYTTIRTYVLYALNDVPCFPRMLFVKIAKNPAESLALCPPFFCEISIDFPCMKWYNVSG